MNVDLDLVRKYNVPGPRYTSYPTALQFRGDVPADALLDVMRRDVAAGGNEVSLYVHIPFCRSLCWYCGCTNVPATGAESADRYLDALEREIALRAAAFPNGRLLARQLHFGGGTPSALSPEQIDRLAAALRGAFDFADDAEISVEIDPRTATREVIDAFFRLGCRRASLGVQDLDAKVQVAIHRVQPERVVREATERLRERGFSSVNFDLIYGLPFQTRERFARTLDGVLALSPDRLSVFSYAHVPWIKPQQKLLEKANAFPSPDEKLEILKSAIERLTRSGYVYIGMDHFAKEDDELAHALRERRLQRNFEGYSTHAGLPIVGLGMSSISQSARGFSQNEKTLDAYEARLAAGTPPVAKGLILSEEDCRRREIIMRVMCDLELDYAAIGEKIGCGNFAETYAAELAKLKPLADDGLVELRGDGLRVTRTGRLFIRNVAMAFDAYFSPTAAGTRHSRTV